MPSQEGTVASAPRLLQELQPGTSQRWWRCWGHGLAAFGLLLKPAPVKGGEKYPTSAQERRGRWQAADCSVRPRSSAAPVTPAVCRAAGRGGRRTNVQCSAQRQRVASLVPAMRWFVCHRKVLLPSPQLKIADAAPFCTQGSQTNAPNAKRRFAPTDKVLSCDCCVPQFPGLWLLQNAPEKSCVKSQTRSPQPWGEPCAPPSSWAGGAREAPCRIPTLRAQGRPKCRTVKMGTLPHGFLGPRSEAAAGPAGKTGDYSLAGSEGEDQGP